jgi:hypothetical protein
MFRGGPDVERPLEQLTADKNCDLMKIEIPKFMLFDSFFKIDTVRQL